MTGTDITYTIEKQVPSCRMLPQIKRHYWSLIKEAINNQKLGKQCVYFCDSSLESIWQHCFFRAVKPDDLPKVNSGLDTESLEWVSTSPENTQISESNVDTQYHGPSTWDFMTADMDLSNGTAHIFNELETYCSSFNVTLNSHELHSGLEEVHDTLERLERLADWMDNVNLRQWLVVEEEHKCLWLGWKRLTKREGNDM